MTDARDAQHPGVDARRAPRAWQVVGSAAAGASCWVIDVSLLGLLVLAFDLPVGLAAAISFIVAGIVNYLLNHLLFAGPGRTRTRSQAVRYLVLTALNVVVTAVGVPAAVQVFSSVLESRALSLVLGKVAVAALLLVPNAVVYHRWVFATPGRTSPSHLE